MFIRKAAFEALELWSEAQELVEAFEDWVIDWRWFAHREDEHGQDEPSFKNECALIH